MKKNTKRKELHMTRPPRLEGKVKNAKMNPVKKRKMVKNIKVRRAIKKLKRLRM